MNPNITGLNQTGLGAKLLAGCSPNFFFEFCFFVPTIMSQPSGITIKFAQTNSMEHMEAGR